MNRTFHLWGSLMILILAACGPASSAPPVFPTFIAPGGEASPVPDEAYPTTQASESNASQVVRGFSLNLQRAWRDGKQVNAELCFTLPDASDWTIWAAHYEYGGNQISEFSSAFLSRQEGNGGQPSERCDQLSFYVPPDADLSASSLTIESVGAYPTNDEYCSLYLPKIQQQLDDRGIGIILDCPEVEEGMFLQIMEIPEGMSQEEAEQLVFSDEFYTIKGPWTFPVTISQ